MERKSQPAKVNRNSRKQNRVLAQITPEQVLSAMARAAQSLARMTHKQRLQKTLKDAGILTPAGKLAARYR